MSQVQNFADVMNAAIDESLSGFYGKIDTVGDWNDGTNANGPWSFQRIVLTDPEAPAKKLTIKLKNRPEMEKGWKGVTVYFCADANGKGLQMQDASYVNKKTGKQMVGKNVMVFPEAEIIPDENAAPRATVAPPGHAAKPAPQAPAKTAPAPRQSVQQALNNRPQDQAPAAPAKAQPRSDAETIHVENKKTVNATRRHLGQRANLMSLCLDAAVHIGGQFEQRHQGMQMSEGQFQAIVSTLFISAEKNVNLDFMPSGDMAEFLPAKKTEGQ